MWCLVFGSLSGKTFISFPIHFMFGLCNFNSFYILTRIYTFSYHTRCVPAAAIIVDFGNCFNVLRLSDRSRLPGLHRPGAYVDFCCHCVELARSELWAIPSRQE